MRTQTLTFKSGETLYLHTPLGVIEVAHERGDNRKVHFRLPEFCSAHRSRKEALFESPFFEEDGLTPKFRVLCPVVDGEGHLVNIIKPDVIRLEGDAHAGVNGRVGTVADAEGSDHGERHAPDELLPV